MEVVNGYVCKNCTDVEYAKKGVDPAHPKDGPDGVYKADKSDRSSATQQAQDNSPVDYGPAVKFDGALAGVASTAKLQPDAYVPGKVADIRA